MHHHKQLLAFSSTNLFRCLYSQSIWEHTTELKKLYFFGICPWFLCKWYAFTAFSSNTKVNTCSLSSYALLKLVMLCGWCCCHICCCCTASCWDWSDVDRRFTRGDTQFAGMIKPTILCPSSVLRRTICIFTFVPLTEARTPSTFVQTLNTEPHKT